jgi:hypothetical protein
MDASERSARRSNKVGLSARALDKKTPLGREQHREGWEYGFVL